MNGWSPLGYVASLVVFSLVVAFWAAVQWNDEFAAAAKHQSVAAAGAMLQCSYRVAGVPVAGGAWLVFWATWMAWALAELWGLQPLTVPLWDWHEGLGSYLKSYHHQPGHRRAVAS